MWSVWHPRADLEVARRRTFPTNSTCRTECSIVALHIDSNVQFTQGSQQSKNYSVQSQLSPDQPKTPPYPCLASWPSHVAAYVEVPSKTVSQEVAFQGRAYHGGLGQVGAGDIILICLYICIRCSSKLINTLNITKHK